jgi:hypothetical protein
VGLYKGVTGLGRLLSERRTQGERQLTDRADVKKPGVMPSHSAKVWKLSGNHEKLPNYQEVAGSFSPENIF